MKYIAYISIAGIGVIGAIPISYVVYDKNNPTGASLLYKSGDKFHEPKFVDYDKIGQGCHNNLFQDSDDSSESDNQMYGCAIMRMEKSSDNKNLRFNSEISIKKGKKGWILNTKISNTKKTGGVNKAYFAYAIMEQENSDGGWQIKSNSDSKSESYLLVHDIRSNETVTIKANGEEWFNGSLSTVTDSSPNYSITKEYRGAWISDNNSGSDDWIFKNFDVSVKDQKLWFDQNFSTVSSDFKVSNIQNSDIKQGFSSVISTSTSDASYNSQNISSWISEIKSIKGKWINLEDICGLINKRNINEKELKNLKIFCVDNGSIS